MMPSTVAGCIAAGADRLKRAGIDRPRREARLLLAHFMGVEPAAVLGHPEYGVVHGNAFLTLVERRARGVPMSHILGRREFWSLEFRVTPDTLDPRPDSETLVEAALAAVAGRKRDPLTVLDLGTGTGCLLLSVLSELPAAGGVAVDRSSAAVAVARDNARRLGLSERAQFVAGDWASALDGAFDLVLANPPYVPSGDIAALQPEVACHEPRLALDGGADGLDAYRRIAADLPRLLASGGIALFEAGIGQWAEVARILTTAGFAVAAPVKDLSGVDRCVICHCS